MGRQRRCGCLDGLCVELGHIVEYSFAISQYHRDYVENEFVQAAGWQRLADGACPTCDVDWTVVGRFGKGSLEAVDEVEGRPTFHVDFVWVAVLARRNAVHDGG